RHEDGGAGGALPGPRRGGVHRTGRVGRGPLSEPMRAATQGAVNHENARSTNRRLSGLRFFCFNTPRSATNLGGTMTARSLPVSLLLVALLALVGCSKKPDEPTPLPKQEPTLAPAPIPAPQPTPKPKD